MYTRCPKCKEVHPLTASVLSRSTGLVQCGRCNRIFNALSFLSDDWHASQTFKPEESASGEMPILGARTKRTVRNVATAAAAVPEPDTDSELCETDSDANSSENGITDQDAEKASSSAASETSQADTADSESSQEDDDSGAEQPESTTKSEQSQNRLWAVGALVLVILTIANVGYTFRDYWLQQPVVHQWLLDNHWLEAERPKGMLKNPAEIQLVSRDMHTHPTRTGILVLSVTFVNLADETQVFPTLRITLLDGGNQPIAQRRLQPIEYLRAGAAIDAGLAPDVFLPILLELGDPGEQAVGFEIEFL